MLLLGGKGGLLTAWLGLLLWLLLLLLLLLLLIILAGKLALVADSLVVIDWYRRLRS